MACVKWERHAGILYDFTPPEIVLAVFFAFIIVGEQGQGTCKSEKEN